MNKITPTAAIAATLLVLTQLAGCNSKPAPAAEATAGGATARVEASADGAAARTQTPASAPDAAAAATISSSGVEARAGDVSVKLPD